MLPGASDGYLLAVTAQAVRVMLLRGRLAHMLDENTACAVVHHPLRHHSGSAPAKGGRKAQFLS